MSTSRIDKKIRSVIPSDASDSSLSRISSASLESWKRKACFAITTVMLDKSQFPVLAGETFLKDALEEMSRLNLGICCLVNKNGRLTGIITDGDIRRKLLKTQKPFSAFFVDDAIEHAIKQPITIAREKTIADAIVLMGENRIWDLPVVADDGKLQGLLHLHPVIEALMNELNHE